MCLAILDNSIINMQSIEKYKYYEYAFVKWVYVGDILSKRVVHRDFQGSVNLEGKKWSFSRQYTKFLEIYFGLLTPSQTFENP